MSPLAIVLFDIDGIVRDVSRSYRRALQETVAHFTQGYHPSQRDIDGLKAEGAWNNDWHASEELIYRYFETQGQDRAQVQLEYEDIVAFFQSKYRGANWNGYIQDEALLVSSDYFQQFSRAGMAWGFVSGATRASASYVLEGRLGLESPLLIAMEDAPGKPDPAGVLQATQRLDPMGHSPTIYVGDTVADMQTVIHARNQDGDRPWFGLGVIPPHVAAADSPAYGDRLFQGGANRVLNQTVDVTPALISEVTG
ncbi:TIGR01548 family HAD-type hydrolase [Candidatus Synechococcus calcipolaris G9]|uniref:TIGR01548 family HAD-type hydrolase n=1 Tax=Candidatus Synechococcus calcipolaris G9 TaxID=1497997 RepID=A0ABT6EX41_9SYNE|nr:TIGR01548 family HAD-type hydrolase [Candidatus Synechococcus calcipolaris]MDG2989917.1 TIGR01548 family HAD-type hydrolase [Candidatus Synechococcus calcipolaris G9]